MTHFREFLFVMSYYCSLERFFYYGIPLLAENAGGKFLLFGAKDPYLQRFLFPKWAMSCFQKRGEHLKKFKNRYSKLMNKCKQIQMQIYEQMQQ